MRLHNYYTTCKNNKDSRYRYLHDILDLIPDEFTTNEFVNNKVNNDIELSSAYGRLNKMKKYGFIEDVGKANDTPNGRKYKKKDTFR